MLAKVARDFEARMADVVLYSTQVCPYCIAAKRLLAARSIPYDEVDVSGDPDKRAWLVETTRRRTVPQIFIKGESIGGYDELSALDKSGQLAQKLLVPA
jgi:glutaredoxin 3